MGMTLAQKIHTMRLNYLECRINYDSILESRYTPQFSEITVRDSGDVVCYRVSGTTPKDLRITTK